MISLFRDFTKSWIFKGLMVLLVLSFAVFGLRDVFNPMNSNNVVTAGTRSITDTDFKARYEEFKQNYTQQNGHEFTNEEFVKAGQHVQMLDELANQTAFSAWLDSLGVKPSPKMIVAEIAKIPAFFNKITGRFDKDTYIQLLGQQNMTEDSFEARVSDQIASSQYLHAELGDFKAPRVYAATEAAYNLQTRDTNLFMLTPNNVAKPPVPSDAQVAAFYQDHLKDLNLPELRAASVVMVSPTLYAKSVVIDEAKLRDLYKQRQNSLKTPETRSFVEVSAPDQSSANEIAAALKAGQDPNAVAKAHKGQVISYEVKPQSAVPDAKVAAAAFALKTGEVSAPITGDLGIAVVKMGDIKSGAQPSFEAAHDQLAEDYRKEKAADKVNEIVNAFQNAHDAGGDFDATAKKLGLTVQALVPMTSEGKTNVQGKDYSAFPVLVKDIFALPAGGTSNVEELGGGQYFAIKLTGIKPSGAPPLAEVKAQMAQYWMAEKMSAALQDKAAEALDRLKKGESFATVAASYNAPVQSLKGLDRSSVQQKKIPEALAGRIFLAKTGGVFTAQLQQFAVAIGQVDAIHQAEPGNANMMASALRTRMSQSVARDVGLATQTGARAIVKTATFPAIAERVLGVTPADAKSKDKSPS